MTKQTIRAEVTARVKNLSPTYCREADAAICRWVIQSAQYQKAKTVFCYVGTEREIDTMRLIHVIMRDGKNVAIPLCVERGVMEAKRIAGVGDLVSGRYGILEPRLECPVVQPEELDLVIVPCCTGNARGERLGYGGGYYDRFLARYRGGTVLLCREKLIREEIPVEPHDYPVPWVLTERGLYEDGTPARLG